jgi:hypothetical protein
MLTSVSPSSIRFQTQGIPAGLPRVLAAIAALALLVLFFSVGAVLLVVLAAAGVLLAAFHSLRRKLQGKAGPLSQRRDRPTARGSSRSSSRSAAGETGGRPDSEVIEVEVVENPHDRGESRG